MTRCLATSKGSHFPLTDSNSIGPTASATRNAAAFSVTGAILDSRTIPESYIFLRDIQRVPYGVQFQDSDALSKLIAPEHPIAILENDVVLIAGTDVLDAFDRLEVLESTAEAIINSRPLGEVVPMPDAVIEELSRAFFK